MKKTVLVTGGAGYIGSHIAWLLAQHQYQVIILDKLIYGQPSSFPWATFVYGDYGDHSLLQQIFAQYQIETVIHCAAFVEVGRSVKKPLVFYDNNVAKTCTLLDLMLQHGVKKIIFSSSCAVYGIPQSVPICEDELRTPISPYGTSKLMVETILDDVQKAHGLSYIAFRYFNVAGALPEYGLGERHDPETHIIPLLLQAAYEHKPFIMYGTDMPTPDGTCMRDYVHVFDIANAHLLALDYLEKGNESFCLNIGSGTGVSIRQMILTVEHICKTNITVQEVDRRAGDPPRLIADIGRVATILAWRPRYSQLDTLVHSAYEFAYGPSILSSEGQEKQDNVS